MKIVLEKSKCIGCGSCVSLCPKFFEMGEDGKSRLKNSRFNDKKEREELGIGQVGCIKEAAEACPIGAIKIYA